MLNVHLISWMLAVASVFWKRCSHRYRDIAMKIALKEIQKLGGTEQMPDGDWFTKRKINIWAFLPKGKNKQTNKRHEVLKYFYDKASTYFILSVHRKWQALGQLLTSCLLHCQFSVPGHLPPPTFPPVPEKATQPCSGAHAAWFLWTLASLLFPFESICENVVSVQGLLRTCRYAF